MADYYTKTAVPATSAALSSAVVRAEFALIETACTKIAAYTGNGGKIVAINAGGTAQEAITTTGTGDGVRATSPSFTTSVISASTTLAVFNTVATTVNAFGGASVALNIGHASGTNTILGATNFSQTVTLIAPVLGTPASGVLTNCTGLPLTAGVTGVLPTANGGTGIAYFTAAGPTVARVYTFPDAAATILYSGGALGTPASGVATNLTGTAAGLTAGNVTTNANLTGHVTSVGNAAVLGSFTVAQLNTAVSDADVVTTGANTFTGTQTLSAAALNEALSTVASATTPDIWVAGVANVIDYTGTATATGFAAAPQAGARRTLVLAGAAVFTAGANMLIDGVASASNFTGAAGDKVHVIAVTTTQFRLTPAKADGTAVAAAPVFFRVVRTAGDITTTSTALVDVTGATGTFTTGAFPVAVGAVLGAYNSTASQYIYLNIDIDGSLELGTNGLAHVDTGANVVQNHSFTHQSAALTAAPHTIKMQWKVNANTGTIQANAGESFSFWAHEIR